MIYLAWKVLVTLSRFRWWDGYTSQNVFISQFSLWALAPLQIPTPSTKGLSFTFQYLLLCKESKYSSLFIFIFYFGKYHVVRKDLGTYVQLSIDSMSYYCRHHPWGEYVGRRNYKPLSFYVSGWNVLLMCTRWVLAIIEDYMMVEYVELLLKLCWISWITIAWWLRT